MPIRDKLPPCPDPERYQLVRTKEGEFWRLKRGLKKPAILNNRLQENSDLVKQTSTAGSRIYGALQPFAEDLALHRIFNKIITLLRGGLKRNGHLNVSVLRGLDLQKDYPLRRLLRGGFQWHHDKEKHVFGFRIDIPERGGAILRQNKIMSAYRFIIILVHGNPGEDGGMQLKSVMSKNYSFEGDGVAGECLLELPYTPEPGQWLFCLRAECLQEGKVAPHPKSRALQVLDGGRWE